MKKYYIGNQLVIELDKEEKSKEKAKKQKQAKDIGLIDILETQHLILQALGVEVE